MTEELEIKPCPFCGSPAKAYGFASQTCYSIQVGCSVFPCAVCPRTGFYDTLTEAAEAWNTRAENEERKEDASD